MKHFLIVLAIVTILFLSACAPNQAQVVTTQPLSSQSPTADVAPSGLGVIAETNTPFVATIEAETSVPSPEIVPPSATVTSTEAVVSAEIVVASPTATEEVSAGSSNTVPLAFEITIADSGRIINMNVGDSFLLNLGSNMYEWTVNVDNQNVISREINMAVINGAQGIYLAHAPGTAKLTAVGNPQCLNSTPPCLAPSILFAITVIVQ